MTHGRAQSLLLLGLFIICTSAGAEESTLNSPSFAESGSFGRGIVTRALFTAHVVDREPGEELITLRGEEQRVYFYTELQDMVGQAAIHRWEYDGRSMGEVTFNVQGPRWRVWSYKTISPAVAGTWRVKVLDNTGEVLAEKILVAE